MSESAQVEFRISQLYLWSGIIVGLFLCMALIGFILLPLWILTYFTQSLIVGKEFIIIKTGIIAKKERKIPFNKINSVDSEENLIWKLMFQSVGKIKIYAGNDSSSINFDGVANPKKVASLINDRISG